MQLHEVSGFVCARLELAAPCIPELSPGSAQKLKDCCAASGGPTRTPSSSSMRIFVFEPPGAEKPPILPPAARTRWQGTIKGAGFLAIASPTSRAASRPAPTSFASAP